MIELKEKLEIVGDFRGSSEVRDISGVMGGPLYSESVRNERMKVYELRMANSCYNTHYYQVDGGGCGKFKDQVIPGCSKNS